MHSGLLEMNGVVPEATCTQQRLLREMASLEVLSTNVAIKAFHSVSGLLNTNATDVTAGFTLLNMTPR